MNGMQGHTMGDAEWHRHQHQASRTVRETMEAEIRFWRNRYEQLSESLHETLKAASPPLLLTHRESYEAGRLVGGRDSATRIKALEKQRDDLLAAFENFIDSHEECTDYDGFTAQIVSMDDYHEAQEAIASVKGELPAWDGEINPVDFRVETYSLNRGGFVLRPENGVRITHVPTGLSAKCDEERSQHRNRHNAFEKLTAMLNERKGGAA